MDLFDLVKTYDIPSNIADELDAFVEKCNPSWSTHQWFKTTKFDKDHTNSNPEDEPKVSWDIPDHLCSASVGFAICNYHESFPQSYSPRFSHVRINAYLKGASMKLHKDHITSLFTFNHPLMPDLLDAPKGVPILSIVGLLKKADKGGDFVMTLPDGKTKKFLTKDRTIIVFPSIFPFMHEVTPVEEGERISYVSWSYY